MYLQWVEKRALQVPALELIIASAPYSEDRTRRWGKSIVQHVSEAGIVYVIWPMTLACIILNLNQFATFKFGVFHREIWISGLSWKSLKIYSNNRTDSPVGNDLPELMSGCPLWSVPQSLHPPDSLVLLTHPYIALDKVQGRAGGQGVEASGKLGVEKDRFSLLNSHHFFFFFFFALPSFQFGERVVPSLRQGLSGTWRSCARQAVWTELSLMFLPRGQTKVSLNLVAAAITMKYYLGSASPHAYSVTGGCCPKRENRTTTPQDPCGTRSACPCPARPTRHANNLHLASHCGAQFVRLSRWFIGLESWTHTQMRR